MPLRERRAPGPDGLPAPPEPDGGERPDGTRTGQRDRRRARFVHPQVQGAGVPGGAGVRPGPAVQRVGRQGHHPVPPRPGPGPQAHRPGAGGALHHHCPGRGCAEAAAAAAGGGDAAFVRGDDPRRAQADSVLRRQRAGRAAFHAGGTGPVSSAPPADGVGPVHGGVGAYNGAVPEGQRRPLAGAGRPPAQAA